MPWYDKESIKKGTWSAEEDATLKSYVDKHGPITNWIALPEKIGLNRCGKSCRLRWMNYLRPDIKHGKFTEEEDKIISDIYFSIGRRWSVMADKLPGRTDNDIKNYWNTKLKRKIAGNPKKERKRYAFQGLNDGLSVDDNPSVFTITNGDSMSTTWPSTSQLYSQDEITGCAPIEEGAELAHPPSNIISFSTNNTTTPCSGVGVGSGGGESNLTPLDPPEHNAIEDQGSMTGQFYFGDNNATTSGDGGGVGAIFDHQRMNYIVKDMADQFGFHENGSSCGSYDLMTTLQGIESIDLDMNMNTNIDLEGGLTSPPPEVSSASLKELQNLLFDESPTLNIMDDFFQHDYTSSGMLVGEHPANDAGVASLYSQLAVEDNNSNLDLLDNLPEWEWKDILVAEDIIGNHFN